MRNGSIGVCLSVCLAEGCLVYTYTMEARGIPQTCLISTAKLQTHIAKIYSLPNISFLTLVQYFTVYRVPHKAWAWKDDFSIFYSLTKNFGVIARTNKMSFSKPNDKEMLQIFSF